MASQERIKLLQAEAKALERLKQLQAEKTKAEKDGNTAYVRQLEENIKKIEKFQERVEGVKEAADSFKSITESMNLSSRATSELTKNLGLVNKQFNAIASMEVSITTTGQDELITLIKGAENLGQLQADLSTAEIGGDTRAIEDIQGKIQAAEGFIQKAQQIQSIQQEILNWTPDSDTSIQDLTSNLDTATSSLGNLIKNNSEILKQNPQLGSSISDYLSGIQKVNKEITKNAGLTEEQINAQKKLTQGAEEMAAKVSAFGNMLFVALKSPFTIIGGIIIGMGKILGAVGKTTREMGGFVGGLTGATTQVTLLGTIFPNALESAKGLSSEFGGLSDTSFETQFNTNLLATNLGVSGKEASQLVGQFSRLNNGSVDTANNLISSTKELAKQKGLIPSSIMADVAGSAQAFAEYGKEGGTNIAEAAVAAGQLGSNLDGVTKVTNQLLDFENSINQELELGARLGKNINFQEARRLAYQGDIRGALQSALQQMGGIEGFNRMDIFQKRAAAAALGLSTEELQKMLSNMDKLNKDGSIQLSTYDKMKESLTALVTGPLGSAVQGFGTLVIGAGQFVTFGKALGPLWNAITVPFKLIGSGIGKILSGMKFLVVESGKFLLNMIKAAAQKIGLMAPTPAAPLNPFELAQSKGLSDKQILSGFGGKEAKDMMQVPESITDKATDSISDKIEDKVKDVELPDKSLPKTSFGDKLKDLAGGLSSMGTPQVLFGALNLIPTGLGFIGLLPGIPGMVAVGALGKFAGKGLMGLAEGLISMTPTLAGAGALAIAALGFTLMIPGSVGMLLMGAAAPIAALGIFALIPALTALGGLMVSGVGALGLAALIGLSVGLGAAFALIGAGAMMFGKGIELAANSLGSFLPKLSTFMESISLGQIGAIGLLSLAFIGLAGSLMLLGAAGLFALPSLLGIAAAASGIAIVAELFGLGGEGKSEETTALESESASTFEKDVLGKIDQLISAVNNGMQVNLDGRQVSIGLERTSGRSLQNNALVRGE